MIKEYGRAVQWKVKPGVNPMHFSGTHIAMLMLSMEKAGFSLTDVEIIFEVRKEPALDSLGNLETIPEETYCYLAWYATREE